MNELIKELASQAQKSVQFLSNSEQSKHNIMMEKFAELIVRECANQCLSDDSMRILNHMGVKGVE